MSSHFVSMEILIQSLLQYQEHLSNLESQIDTLAGGIEALDLLRSIPGIGNKIAATILSEVGEIERFSNATKNGGFRLPRSRCFFFWEVYDNPESNL